MDDIDYRTDELENVIIRMNDHCNRIQEKYNALREAVERMVAADSPGVWNAKEYMEARADVNRLLKPRH